MNIGTVIDRPGVYLTRNGRTVRIYAITGDSSFPCKGGVQYTTPTGRVKYRFNSWSRLGVKNILPGSGLDIVAYVGA